MRKKTRWIVAFLLVLLVGVSLVFIPPLLSPRDDHISVDEIQLSKASEVIWSNNQFALDLYPKLISEGDNIFFSPWSISSTLAMVYEGAGGQTAEEILSVLHLPANDTVRRRGYATFFKFLNHLQGSLLETANALWPHENYPFAENYLDLVREYYSAKIGELDYSHPEIARKTINDWVAEKTKGKIENLLEEGTITTLTRLVLTNCIYFKGDWLKHFPKKATEQKDFKITPQQSVKVPMMQMDDKFKYTETNLLQVIELLYAGKDLSMMVLLPKENLTTVEKTLSANKLQTIREEMQLQNVTIHLPKFTLHPKYGSDTLPAILKELGMPTAFKSNANLSKMTGSPNKLFLDDVVHAAYVHVNEKGTEAAAGTGAEIPMGPTPHMNYMFANHPFMFFIQENSTGNILFIGRVVDPRQAG